MSIPTHGNNADTWSYAEAFAALQGHGLPQLVKSSHLQLLLSKGEECHPYVRSLRTKLLSDIQARGRTSTAKKAALLAPSRPRQSLLLREIRDCGHTFSLLQGLPDIVKRSHLLTEPHFKLANCSHGDKFSIPCNVHPNRVTTVQRGPLDRAQGEGESDFLGCYGEEAKTIFEMGFYDEEAVRAALLVEGGNVQRAVESLLDVRGTPTAW